eukprot:TRINITY_DN2340_c1_g1_i1.p1 TRINITY_DN2340_c1_g1~~TRINITY_DN2340_c1_g1_i1.p1  ORF type:complete len:155 (-),score=37.96 TRINITY_DN2340_c1_g1_i1:237-701(-)
MGKFLKTGKVVIMLSGRHAGRKAVIVRTVDDGTKDRKFGYCIVAGVERPPRRITRAMGKKKIERRSRVVPFIKCVNFNHIMPTRYQVDIGDKLKKIVTADVMKDAALRRGAAGAIRHLFRTRYVAQGTPARKAPSAKQQRAAVGVNYLFTKLRF